jgi:ribonuclease HI
MTTANRPRGRWNARRWALLFTIVSGCALLTNCGILGNFRGNPGYASFGSPGFRDTDREFALSLGPLPLKLARWITHDDPELAAMLDGLKAVRVYTYDVDGDAQRVSERMEDVRDRLVEQGWDQVVAVRDDGEHVDALLKLKAGAIRGMAVVVQDDEEVVLVNVIGNIKPENFSSMMAELDIDLPHMMVQR